MTTTDDYALVTGASLGIGKEMVKELAARGINTLLVALDTPALAETEKYLNDNYDIKVHSFAADLTDPAVPGRIFEWCEKNGYRVSYLLNNAGFGEGGNFEDIPLERYLKMIDLNNKAYISMIYQFLPPMKKRGYGHIMNTSSMEATVPLPYKSVYTGTKNFVYAFSLALNEEVRRFGVKVSILCPGPVLTNEGGLERIKAQGNKAKVLLLMPDRVAKVAVKHMLGGMLIINPGFMNWMITKIVKFIPTRIKMHLLEKIFSVYK